MKEGTFNMELLQFKLRFPREILLCRVCYSPCWYDDFSIYLLPFFELMLFLNSFILIQVGDFYEAIGFDACVLVEYAGLNPFGGLRSDSNPRAGCPVMVCIFILLIEKGVSISGFHTFELYNVICKGFEEHLSDEFHPRVVAIETEEDTSAASYSDDVKMCIVEELQGPSQARSRKSRFVSGHAHPGSPYVFGLAGVDHDVEFPDPMPVIGILILPLTF
ncbi:hypothetical protein ZIOFF_027998 [Zingiber officinale]|uniref:Uncharacterized protein n=1 Tax=Zingiber officinale TaxID=94328 RepID=A0A8J5GM85_ZINOF|nr:hypothetical protein ZIOFF_027998 [Zingiber officinale]